ncbi:mucin-5B [Drosophila biarmipes]|uniref:mucin-5B n=1 Tax=Drosophila biarmipes TaxID=125945 RepID=UPI001CDB46CC|nr:mucin-5B [Drosophila biarmipes]
MRSGLTLCPLLVVLLVGHRVALVAPAHLLTSYLPASMQALAYYIDLLQYEPLSSTTVEPPFSADDAVEATTAASRPSTALPTRTRTTTTRRPGGTGALGSVWWQPPSWWETSSPPPPPPESTTASAPPSTPVPTRMRTTTTTKSTTPTKRPSGTGALGSAWQAPSWWVTSPPPPLSTESTTASARPSTPLPTRMSTTTTTTSTTTTRRPSGTGALGSAWQAPSWWQPPQRTSSTARPSFPPTVSHRPGIFAPVSPPERAVEGQTIFDEIEDDDADFDSLPLSLIRDIQNERHDFTNDVESLDNFLRLYDDNYGRAAFDVESAMDRWSTTSIAGKKRVPPTKPYVDFLLVYDLLKRDAKAANLSKYEGYSEDLLEQLHELSQASSARQLHTLFQRMLDRGDVQRSDVVARVQGIVKDLGNPKSATSKALAFIPSMQFLP